MLQQTKANPEIESLIVEGVVKWSSYSLNNRCSPSSSSGTSYQKKGNGLESTKQRLACYWKVQIRSPNTTSHLFELTPQHLVLHNITISPSPIKWTLHFREANTNWQASQAACLKGWQSQSTLQMPLLSTKVSRFVSIQSENSHVMPCIIASRFPACHNTWKKINTCSVVSSSYLTCLCASPAILHGCTRSKTQTTIIYYSLPLPML